MHWATSGPRPTSTCCCARRENKANARRALLTLPDKIASQLDPEWFADGATIRVVDAFVVALMFSACGETIESLRDHIVAIDLDGVPLRTLDLEGLLKTKQSSRDKDKLDRLVLERALQALRRGDASG